MGSKARSAASWLKGIGQRMREARKARSLAADEVAAWVSERALRESLGKSTYYQFEAGDHEPSFSNGMLICAFLKIRPQWLFLAEGPMDA
jgi:transcriptional regulator with XRE-family HTH domain